MNAKKAKEDVIHFIFLILGLIAVGSVLVITRNRPGGFPVRKTLGFHCS